MKRLWAIIGKVAYYSVGTLFLPFLLNGSKRVRVAIIDRRKNQLVMSRTWLSKQQWTLVGGGIHRNEDKIEAAIREVKEETGLTLKPDQLEQVAEIEEDDYMSRFTSYIFIAELSEQELKAPLFEILDLGWYSLNSLPNPYNNQVLSAAGLLHKTDVE